MPKLLGVATHLKPGFGWMVCFRKGTLTWLAVSAGVSWEALVLLHVALILQEASPLGDWTEREGAGEGGERE